MANYMNTRTQYPYNSGHNYNPPNGGYVENRFQGGVKTKYKPLYSHSFKLPNSIVKTVVRERFHTPSFQIKKPATQSSRSEYICLNELELADLVENYKTKFLPAIAECKKINCSIH